MAIVITKQPTNVAANVNDTVSITLEATGDGLVYDWQYSTNGTKFYSLSASASASNWTYDQPTLTFKGYSGYLKYYFRCKLTDVNGDSVFTNIVRAINLAEAGAGFILPETLQGIADLIREKEESAGGILPVDMEDRLRTLLENSNTELTVIEGTTEINSGTQRDISLGTILPDSDAYVFIIYKSAYVSTASAFGLAVLVEWKLGQELKSFEMSFASSKVSPKLYDVTALYPTDSGDATQVISKAGWGGMVGLTWRYIYA